MNYIHLKGKAGAICSGLSLSALGEEGLSLSLELHHNGEGELLFIAAQIRLPKRCVAWDASADRLSSSDIGGILLCIRESRHGCISDS